MPLEGCGVGKEYRWDCSVRTKTSPGELPRQESDSHTSVIAVHQPLGPAGGASSSEASDTIRPTLTRGGFSITTWRHRMYKDLENDRRTGPLKPAVDCMCTAGWRGTYEGCLSKQSNQYTQLGQPGNPKACNKRCYVFFYMLTHFFSFNPFYFSELIFGT